LAYLQKHFQGFKVTISELINSVVKSTLSLFGDVQLKFRKTAQNFHYEFNVRHLTNVFQVLLQAKQDAIKEPDNLIRLWVHECERIFGDRLVDAKDLATYR
jgi:dynein heavy chain